jgi:hypothetical protein
MTPVAEFLQTSSDFVNNFCRWFNTLLLNCLSISFLNRWGIFVF